MTETSAPSAPVKLSRTRGLKPPFNAETARAASLQAAKKASQRTKTRLDAAEVEKNARAYLVSHLPELIVALVNRARENPDGPAMARVLERALPMLNDVGAGKKVLEGLTLEISREGVRLQLPGTKQVTSDLTTLDHAPLLAGSELREGVSVGVSGGGSSGTACSLGEGGSNVSSSHTT